MSMGVVVNFHYCMNRLSSISFFENHSNVCARCGMKLHKSLHCCHDEVQVIKLSPDQTKSQVVLDMHTDVSTPVLVPSSFLVASFTNDLVKDVSINVSPPLLSPPLIYIENRVFRI
jgi:hypothetical protein